MPNTTDTNRLDDKTAGAVIIDLDAYRALGKAKGVKLFDEVGDAVDTAKQYQTPLMIGFCAIVLFWFLRRAWA
jgi:hypothetical protein